jgi:hypothetical protein
MKVDECITNEDCLKFLFKNDRYFLKIIRTRETAARYISENKMYSFYYNSITQPISIKFHNRNFENMIRRPEIYLEETRNSCAPTSVEIVKRQYTLNDAERDYLKNYGMAYYYVNRIIKKIEVLRNNIQNSQNSECPIKLSNPDCIIGNMSVYNQINQNLSISERGTVMITMPKIYFPNLRDVEINKNYNINDILHLYRLNLSR